MPPGSWLPFYNNFLISSIEEKALFQGGGDAGSSLHVIQPTSQPRQRMHSRLKRSAALIFNF
jgi:hypothetical protein